MLLFVANTLLPVFLVMALGWLLARLEFLSPRALADINRLTYWLGLPALLFYKLAGTAPGFARVLDLFLVVAGATLLGMILALLAARWLTLSREALGPFVQAAFRGNLAFIGLPVVVYTFPGQGDIQGAALLVLGPMVVFYNVASVLVLMLSLPPTGRRVLPALARGLVTNPLLIACVAGVGWSLTGWPLPLMLERTLAALGQMALPLALLCIGGSLVTVRLRGRVGPALLAAAFKTLIIPLLGVGLAWLLGVEGEGLRVTLILLACPTAAASYVLVRQMGGDQGLASGAVLATTLLSLPALVLVLALT